MKFKNIFSCLSIISILKISLFIHFGIIKGGWKQFEHGLDPAIKAWEMITPHSPIPYIKIEGVLPASPLVNIAP
jgi:hypothetical protein